MWKRTDKPWGFPNDKKGTTGSTAPLFTAAAAGSSGIKTVFGQQSKQQVSCVGKPVDDASISKDPFAAFQPQPSLWNNAGAVATQRPLKSVWNASPSVWNVGKSDGSTKLVAASWNPAATSEQKPSVWNNAGAVAAQQQSQLPSWGWNASESSVWNVGNPATKSVTAFPSWNSPAIATPTPLTSNPFAAVQNHGQTAPWSQGGGNPQNPSSTWESKATNGFVSPFSLPQTAFIAPAVQPLNNAGTVTFPPPAATSERGSSGTQIPPMWSWSAGPTWNSGNASSNFMLFSSTPKVDASCQTDDVQPAVINTPPPQPQQAILSFGSHLWTNALPSELNPLEPSVNQVAPSTGNTGKPPSDSTCSVVASTPATLVAAPDVNPYGKGDFGAGFVDQQVQAALTAAQPSIVERQNQSAVVMNTSNRRISTSASSNYLALRIGPSSRDLGLNNAPMRKLPTLRVTPRFKSTPAKVPWKPDARKSRTFTSSFFASGTKTNKTLVIDLKLA